MGICNAIKSKKKENVQSVENKPKNNFNIKYNNESELIGILNKFSEKIEIQDSFFEINDTSDDNIYNILKKEEKKELTDYFNTKKNIFMNIIKKFNLNVSLDYDSLSSQIINNNKNGQNTYKNKIKNEVSKISSNKDSFKINNLNIIVVGKSGVGKSTLINNVLKIKDAITGTGSFQTIKIKAYYNKALPYLRLIDTRGIEINHQYGADAIMKDAQNYIKEQLSTNNINNFVHCIWYCITGDRFEQAEIDLLNSLKYTYPDNKIPIIIVYTQATDENIISDMKKYIKEININEKFIKILAERKKLIDKNYLEAFGLDELLDETFKKCKLAIKGDMHSVMTTNISQHIKKVLIQGNSKIQKNIIEKVILNFIKDYNVKNDDEFKKYISEIYESNIKYYLNIDNSNDKNNEIQKSFLISRECDNFIKYYKDKTHDIILRDLMDLSTKFLDYQALKEIENQTNINIKNKRCLDDFVNSSSNFLNDNFYYLAQKYYIRHVILNYLRKFSISFEKYLNEMIGSLFVQKDIQDSISECFLKKFEEFENNIKNEYFFMNNENNTNINNNIQNEKYNNNNNANIVNNYDRSIPKRRQETSNENQTTTI
jgi:energy-coupling factor transporter ATP-binding protein EcfA2